MKLLVLGGTVFVSREVAIAARDRGHDVVSAARGVSGDPPPGVRFVRVDRRRPDGLDPLAGESFDAVVDVARQSVRQVRAALRALGDRAAHWTFVSTRSVYADKSTPGLTASAQLLEAADDAVDEEDPANYGRLKVAAEQAVLDAFDGRAFIPRPGLVGGRGDVSDRYGYWPARLVRGGEVLCAGRHDDPVQLIDVRDLAVWIVLAAEQRLVGVYDATSPTLTFGDVITTTAAVTAAAGGGRAELAWVPSDVVLEQAVNPWMGQRSLPLWLPQPEFAGMGLWDVTASLDAGMAIRPIDSTAADSLAWERHLGLSRPRAAGLTPAEETGILAAWHAQAAPA